MSDDETTMRERVLDTVRHFPGIHFRGIVKELDTSTALVRYHVQHLLDDGQVRALEVGGFVRYFPTETYRELTADDRAQLHVLRQSRPLEIVLALLEFGSMQHRDILEIVGGSKGTLTYHLNKLVDAGIVRKVPRGQDKGFHLRDPAHLRELLARYEPAGDVVETVHDTWEDLFGGHRGPRDD